MKVMPITPVIFNQNKPREEPAEKQESYHAYIKRKYREIEENNANLYSKEY